MKEKITSKQEIVKMQQKRAELQKEAKKQSVKSLYLG